ncbi:MAG: DegT/DnrJ/EryC1/StrS family aminotransferase [Planctomycetes bacterium]|nr:DegT/DnrJ/EryC1/StrS family aminotransferase [Planctomycetota bacterium]
MRVKQDLGDLAISGGPPAFEEPVHVGRPNLGPREALFSRLEGVLDRRWLTNDGELVHEFERRVAGAAGVRHCIATCNGEIGLEIAIRALELRGEVIVPAFTFVATAHSLQWQEITPVFADVDPRTHVIDPRSVERLITPKTTGILGVHLWGQTCDVEALGAIARRRGLKLIFDAAHAFGCSRRGRPVGGFGHAEVFSFHATKFVNSLEGGAVVTDDDELARRIRLMKNFGFVGYDDVAFVGTNGKMNEFCAAMGLTSLDAMDSFVAINARNHAEYARELNGITGLRLLEPPAGERTNWQYVVVDVDPERCPLGRDDLLDLLWTENVQARRYFYPGLHRMEPYRSHFPNAHLLLPSTIRAAAGVLVLPTGQSMDPEAIAIVASVIRLGVERADEVRAALRVTVRPRHPRRRTDPESP